MPIVFRGSLGHYLFLRYCGVGGGGELPPRPTMDSPEVELRQFSEYLYTFRLQIDCSKLSFAYDRFSFGPSIVFILLFLFLFIVNIF